MIRPCMGSLNQIATLIQRGNRTRRENEINYWSIILCTYYLFLCGNYPFPPPPPRWSYSREIPLSSLPSFRFCVHIIFFLLRGNHPPHPTAASFTLFAEQNFIFELTIEQHASSNRQIPVTPTLQKWPIYQLVALGKKHCEVTRPHRPRNFKNASDMEINPCQCNFFVD